jgi:hypothetical protein
MSSAIDCLGDAWHIARTWQKAAHRISALSVELRPQQQTDDNSDKAIIT